MQVCQLWVRFGMIKTDIFYIIGTVAMNLQASSNFEANSWSYCLGIKATCIATINWLEH